MSFIIQKDMKLNTIYTEELLIKIYRMLKFKKMIIIKN